MAGRRISFPNVISLSAPSVLLDTPPPRLLSLVQILLSLCPFSSSWDPKVPSFPLHPTISFCLLYWHNQEPVRDSLPLPTRLWEERRVVSCRDLTAWCTMWHVPCDSCSRGVQPQISCHSGPECHRSSPWGRVEFAVISSRLWSGNCGPPDQAIPLGFARFETGSIYIALAVLELTV